MLFFLRNVLNTIILMVDLEKSVGSLINLTGRIELAEDAILLNEEFKKNVAIPYFKDIYKDLQSQSDDKTKGINRVSLLNVGKTFK